MRLIQSFGAHRFGMFGLVMFGSVLVGLAAQASPLDDNTLADQALAIIGARVANSTHKCAGCHHLDAPKLRTWFMLTSHVGKDCFGPWFSGRSAATAEAALTCFSLNGHSPFEWGPKKLGLWAARVNSDDFTDIFTAKYSTDTQRELNKFRQRSYMPRSGALGFTDEQWALVYEYVDRGAPLLEEKLSVPAQQAVAPAEVENVALALSATVNLEGLTLPLGNGKSIELRFGNTESMMATDEFGRRCLMKDGELIPFMRDDEPMYRLEGATEGGGGCHNGFTFRLLNGRFTRVDHGFSAIFKYYATQSCSVVEGIDLPPPRSNLEKLPVGRPLSDDEAQMITDCFLKRDRWATVKALYERYVQKLEQNYPMREACTTQVLRHAELTVLCSKGFKKLGIDSGFQDLVVLKEGAHWIRGAGSEASNYILHPDFRGTMDLRGHGNVFHLPRHSCSSPDVFRGCVSMVDRH